jgi:pSer/pThr/pTyr-binding forkhead associated (FHA) protein
MPFLIVRSGPRSGERIELIGELVVGRENADLTVHDEEVSRRHLAVRPHEDGVELEDLGSTNGTFVDGVRLSAVVVVSSGARVTLGETELEIEVEVPEPEVDPGATRLRERPPERDATIVRPTPPAAAPKPPPDATIAGAPAPPAAAPKPPPDATIAGAPAPPAAAPKPPPDATIAGAPAPPAAAPKPPPDATIAGAPAPPAPPTAPPRAAPAPVATAPSPPAPVDARPFGTFTPTAPARRRTGAATRQWGPATIVFLVIIATAVALIIYFAAR